MLHKKYGFKLIAIKKETYEKIKERSNKKGLFLNRYVQHLVEEDIKNE